jgi:hypothetical protein
LVLQPLRYLHGEPSGRQYAGDGSRYTGNNAITAPTNIYRKGAATDDATINGDTTKTFNLGIIDALVERAGVASPLIRPIMVNGEKSTSCSCTTIR